MPAFPITDKNSGWTAWKAGLVSAANVGLSLNSSVVTPTIHNLAVRKGYNAIRLQLAWAGPYSIVAADIVAIASKGWDDSAITVSTQNTTNPVTYKQVALQIDRILGLSKGLGIGVIFAVMDFYQGPGGALWQQASLQDALVGFWAATVRRWPAAQFPQVMGYDLLNEPYPDPTLSFAELNALAPNPATLNNWRALANRVVSTIRAVDTTTPVLVEGVYGGAARGLDVFRNLSDNNDKSLLVQDPSGRVVYSFHVYAPLPFTHQGVTNWAYEASGTLYGDAAYAHWHVWDYYNADPNNGRGGVDLSQNFTSYVSLVSHYRNDAYYSNRGKPNTMPDFHKQFGVPVFVGEFSAVNPRLSKASTVPASDSHRTITAISVDNGKVTITMGNLDANGFRIDCGPSAAAWPFTNQVLLTVSGSGTALDGQSYLATLAAGQKTFSFNATTALANFSTAPKGTDATNNGVGTLTLALPPVKQSALESARQRYTRDVLKMCKEMGFSWAWHFEDNELAGEFNGWRPSAGVVAILSAAANGYTVS